MATILVAEEDPMNRRFLATLLHEHGHRALEVSSGEEMLRIIRNTTPDLVLVDMLMPDLDITQFIANLRLEPEMIRSRVVFSAAECVEPEARELAYALGMPFAAKPVNPDTLLAVIHETLTESPRILAERERRGEPKSFDALFRAMFGKLSRYTAGLENQNARLNQSLVEYTAQLNVARVAVDQEISKRLGAEQELTQEKTLLRDQAIRDGLTGLFNRRYMEESLILAESHARRGGHSLGISLIDIDHFKRINDRFGHAGGDIVISAVGRCLAYTARGEDVVSRYGGDEFVLVMLQASQDILVECAERFRQSVRKLEMEYDGQQIGTVTLSIGMGIFPDHGDSGLRVLRAADMALYRAKQAGRDCVVMANKMDSDKGKVG